MGQIFQLQTQGTNQFDDVKPVVATPASAGGIIDVIRDFPWTGTPLSQYQVDKTPYILLHEFDLTTNAAVATFLYYKNFVTQGFTSDGLNRLSELIDTAGDNAFTKSAKEIISKVDTFVTDIGIGNGIIDPRTGGLAGTTIGEFVNGAVQGFRTGISTAATFLNALDGGISNVRLTDKYLQPYNLLYQRSQTGFKYVFPYLSPERGIISTFGGSPEGLLQKNPLGIGSMLGVAKEAIEQFASLFTLTSPGAFIEQPKYYSFGNDEESYKISFPLINTRDRDTYQKNFELIFLLFYQNRAFRRSVSRVVPPKIYSARIPGLTELPFCYMNTINVTFVGNRRNVNLINPAPGGGVINCIVPDAYEVTINLRSLLEPTANMMLSNELQSTNFRGDPKQILQSIRASVGIQGTGQTTFLQSPLTSFVRTTNNFNEQLLVNPVISTRGLQTLSRLRGRL